MVNSAIKKNAYYEWCIKILKDTGKMFITVEEASKILGNDKRTFYNLVARREIQGEKVMKRLMLSVDSLSMYYMKKLKDKNRIISRIKNWQK